MSSPLAWFLNQHPDVREPFDDLISAAYHSGNPGKIGLTSEELDNLADRAYDRAAAAAAKHGIKVPPRTS